MREFKDLEDRMWRLQITFREVKKVLKDTGDEVNLANALDDDCALLTKLATDPMVLMQVLYILVEDQIKSVRNCDHAEGAECVECERDFGGAMAGDGIEAATKALLEELADFFRPAQREVMRAMLRRIDGLEKKATRAMVAVVEGPAIEKMLQEELDKSPIPIDLGAGEDRQDGS